MCIINPGRIPHGACCRPRPLAGLLRRRHVAHRAPRERVRLQAPEYRHRQGLHIHRPSQSWVRHLHFRDGCHRDGCDGARVPGAEHAGRVAFAADFAIGGVVPLHTHPLATETLLVLKGSIYTGFVDSNNVLYASTLQPGDVTIFPRALLHFQLNVGNETAITFNTLTSQNPGFLVTANQISMPNIPSAVIEKSFGVDAKTVKEMKVGYPRYWNN